MNRLRPSRVCLVCGMDIWGRLQRTELIRLRAEYARMIDNGICDDCTSNRMEAAQEYENAVAELRLVSDLGASWSHTRPPMLHPALRLARHRVAMADAWCVRLKMWPAADRRRYPTREESK